jgi:hypothetical protein
MKNYKKLTIPEDSSWNRKTVSAYIWRNLHWRIRYFIGGCKNIIRWIPTLYKDKDWDDWYIFTILQKKIEFQREEIIYANRHIDVDRDNRDMTIVLNLIERVKEEYYDTEYLDYEESKFRFEPVEGSENLKSLEIDVLSEKYDEFLKKYPSSVRKVLKEKPELDKKDLCFYVSKHNQVKAHDLLFKILKERMRWWWD